MTVPPSLSAASVRSVLAGAVTQLKEAWLSPLAVVGAALSPTAYGLTVIAGYGLPTGALLLGCVAAGLWGNLYAQGALIVIQERARGTLTILAATPARISAPLFGRLIAATCQSIAAIPVITLLIVALFGGVHDFELPLFVVALAPITVGLFGMGLLLMGALVRYRYSAGMVNGLFGAIVLLGGFFAPASAMPLGVRVVSSALPSTWAIQAVRPTDGHAWADLGIAGPLALAWFAVGMMYLSGAHHRLRKTGSYQQ